MTDDQTIQDGAHIEAESGALAENSAPVSEDIKTDAELEIPAEIDDDSIDFEAMLLSDLVETEPEKEQPREESETKTENVTETGITARLNVLKSLADELAKLPESPDESNTTRILRKLNKELVKTQETELNQLKESYAFGTPEKIKESLELTDGLYGYDTAQGRASAEKFAKTLVEKDPEHAYNVTLDLMRQQTKDGVILADAFTRNVLGLDVSKLKVFQAISRGETPEGYESFTDNQKDLASIPVERHEAFKTLSPKMRDIVLDGMQTYSSELERIEANKVLNLAQKDIADKQSAEVVKANEAVQFNETVDKTFDALSSDFSRSMSEMTTNALDKLDFSSDAFTNTSIKYALAGVLRDVLSDELQPRAKSYFIANGVEEAEVDKQFQRAKTLFAQITEAATIESNATARKQTAEAARQAAIRNENKKRLLGVAVSLAAQVARKNGAKMATQAAQIAVPQNIAPNISEQTSLGNFTGKELTAADVVAANKAGVRLGA